MVYGNIPDHIKAPEGIELKPSKVDRRITGEYLDHTAPYTEHIILVHTDQYTLGICVDVIVYLSVQCLYTCTYITNIIRVYLKNEILFFVDSCWY